MVRTFPRRFRVSRLSALLALYLVASAVHFAHNAEYVADYPNLPAWITRSSVYASWLGIQLIGIVGYVLFVRHHSGLGLALLMVYAALGRDGLLHYTLAPASAHTHAMNLTIWSEVAAASVLLAYLVIVARPRIVAP